MTPDELAVRGVPMTAFVVGREIRRNEPLRDGTPRHEKGFRPYVETVGPDMHPLLRTVPQKRYWQGPLFGAEADAKNWQPVMFDVDGCARICAALEMMEDDNAE